MLIAKNLSKSFKEVNALNNISLAVQEGELYGLLGPNGAGKTTTISILSSLLKPDSGEILYQGKSLYQNLTKSKKMIGVVPQEIALYEDLTALENLKFWGTLYGIKGKELQSKTEELLDFLGLSDRKNHKIKTYSGGMKRRINIAAALLHDPKIVFMDEPTVGIDPQSRNLIFEVIQELHSRGLTMIYTTHYMEEAERLCDRIGIIDEGKIIAEGSLEELKKSSKINEEIHVRFTNVQKTDLSNINNHFNGQLLIHENQMVLSTSLANTDLPILIQMCTKANLHLENLQVKSLSLESIFLELTGKSLRD
ncbi:ATP-binding cassette domain-containing protein [Labilibaculum sp. A4]|uniref:ABC transporter ATP-binding protein n=1 Tax=Labilibaculum euxinus TaxID=2686357 RepID=UPI000F61E874|nr:ABC transporter ATP-binding protein [Labilibaculum euxinus]MDQ1771122.1 ABC transporter ATP-binding protein [Labilibaculum euxinus]MWN76871.1 ATP-binding cassette domain-containing protein [Labilibaculum euxinus]